MEHKTELVVAKAERWQAERGDLTRPWDEAQGHLAIVIDDIGRELHVLGMLMSLRFRLTFAILPGSIYAAGSQLRLREDARRYREILLHLPMEPLDPTWMARDAEVEESFLLVDDGPVIWAEKVEAALAKVPAAIGVNNHMGSRLTTDPRAMDAIMVELAERDLLFLDSRTNADSQAEQAARRAGLLTGARHVFLDTDPSEAAIERSLAEAADWSVREPVIAIGHPSALLYQVLLRRLPELHARGVGIYPVSWVLAHRADR